MDEILSYFQRCFDKAHALKAGVIVPSPGLNQNYDKALADIKSVEEQLAHYLTKQSKHLDIKVPPPLFVPARSIDISHCSTCLMSRVGVTATN